MWDESAGFRHCGVLGWEQSLIDFTMSRYPEAIIVIAKLSIIERLKQCFPRTDQVKVAYLPR